MLRRLTVKIDRAWALWKPRFGIRRTSGVRGFENDRLRPARQLALALVTAAARLAVTRTGTATDALALLVLLDALIDVVNVHSWTYNKCS